MRGRSGASAEALAVAGQASDDLAPGTYNSILKQAGRRMYEAIELHVEGLREDKQPVPPSTSFAEYVVVRA
jgi:hypothetical protein